MTISKIIPLCVPPVSATLPQGQAETFSMAQTVNQLIYSVNTSIDAYNGLADYINAQGLPDTMMQTLTLLLQPINDGIAANVQGITAVIGRVATLETKAATTEEYKIANDADIININIRLATMEASAAAHATAINTLSGRITAIEAAGYVDQVALLMALSPYAAKDLQLGDKITAVELLNVAQQGSIDTLQMHDIASLQRADAMELAAAKLAVRVRRLELGTFEFNKLTFASVDKQIAYTGNTIAVFPFDTDALLSEQLQMSQTTPGVLLPQEMVRALRVAYKLRFGDSYDANVTYCYAEIVHEHAINAEGTIGQEVVAASVFRNPWAADHRDYDGAIEAVIPVNVNAELTDKIWLRLTNLTTYNEADGAGSARFTGGPVGCSCEVFRIGEPYDVTAQDVVLGG